jgi:exodeoxyribonuclease III
MASMRIATWNVNGLRARLDYLCLWLEAREPDVVGLQELKLADDQFPRERFAELGYHATVYGQKAWNGVAVLSRIPAEVIQRGLPGQEAAGARLLAVEVDGLEFTTLYCPNGKTLDHPDYRMKLSWFEALAAYWSERSARDAPAVLGGDFNIVPGPLDTWLGADGDGRIFHTVEERQRFEVLLRLRLVDLYRDRHPDGRAFSWWDYRGGAFHRGHGLRIDLLLGNDAVRRRVREVVIDRDFRKKHDELGPSDHAPVYADLT